MYLQRLSIGFDCLLDLTRLVKRVSKVVVGLGVSAIDADGLTEAPDCLGVLLFLEKQAAQVEVGILEAGLTFLCLAEGFHRFIPGLLVLVGHSQVVVGRGIPGGYFYRLLKALYSLLRLFLG